MEFTNSSLADYTKISPNKSIPRNHVIDTITPHCFVGQVSVERAGEVFANPKRQASCNYAIGYDGKIALICDEKDRSWCSGGLDKNGNPIRVNGISGADNDQRAITIEIASDTEPPYKITDEAYEATIKLFADVAIRNGIKEWKWKADKSLTGNVEEQNVSVHRWFACKSCPGDYIYEHLPDIVEKANAIIRKHGVDNTPDEWAKSAVEFAVDNKVLFGDNNGNYKLHKDCSRQEMMVFLYRYYNLIKNNRR